MRDEWTAIDNPVAVALEKLEERTSYLVRLHALYLDSRCLIKLKKSLHYYQSQIELLVYQNHAALDNALFSPTRENLLAD